MLNYTKSIWNDLQNTMSIYRLYELSQISRKNVSRNFTKGVGDLEMDHWSVL